MDKITRMLILYTELAKGENINKTVFCFENDCSPRTFERDIEDIRLFLSESFNLLELNYDKLSNTYYIEGAKRAGLEPIEYLFIERILRDTAFLRKDELEQLLAHLLSSTENTKALIYNKSIKDIDYQSPAHNKALLKIHGDLVSIIEKKKCIKIRYFKGNGDEIERDIIPCTIKFDLGYMYLIGYRNNETDKYPAYYRLDRIYSFNIIRDQTYHEKEKVNSYMTDYSSGITQMYGGEYVELCLKCKKEFYPYLYDKFRSAKIDRQDENAIEVRISAFEDGFLKWMISQPQDMIMILQPASTKNKLVEEAQKIINKYGGTQ